MISDPNDGLMITLDNLKEELKDKSLQINKLIEENSSLRNKLNENNNNNFQNEHNKSFSSSALNDSDKVKLLQDEIKELKLMNDSDQIQIKTLKEDIKELSTKLKNIQTLNGQIKDFNEFINLLNQVLANYKPKKKEQKDSLNKLVSILNNFII